MKLPLEIDRTNGIPVYVQLVERIRLLILQGVLRVGDPMPTVREMAVALGVNANTVARVYRELQQAGWLRLERGVGTFVAEGAAKPMSPATFGKILKQVDALIGNARRANMSRLELSQMIESRWSEVKSDAKR